MILVGGFNPLEKYARQIGSLPQVGVKIPPTRIFPPVIFLPVIFTADPEVFIDTITPDRLVRCTMAAIDFNHSTFKSLRRCKHKSLINDKLLSHSKSSNTIFKKGGCVNLDLWEKDLVHLKRPWTLNMMKSKIKGRLEQKNKAKKGRSENHWHSATPADVTDHSLSWRLDKF